MLGEDHPEAVITMNDMAITLRAQGSAEHRRRCCGVFQAWLVVVALRARHSPRRSLSSQGRPLRGVVSASKAESPRDGRVVVPGDVRAASRLWRQRRRCRGKLAVVPVESVNAKIGLPFGLGEIGGEWKPESAERDAAWEMYVELITRISVVELGRDEGLLREALTSLYSLFNTTRGILRRYGPAVARPAPGSAVSFGHLAVSILNGALRPLLAEWHPRLEDREFSRPANISRLDWERSWDRHSDLRAAIAAVRQTLAAYAGVLGEVCDAKSLLHLASPGSNMMHQT